MAWVTIGEAQALLGLSGRTTLNNLAKNGTIPTRMGLLRGRKVQLFQTDGLAELWAANVQPRMKRTAEPSPAPLDPPPAPPDPAPVPVAVAPAPKAGKRRSAAVPIEPPAGSAAADFDENGVPVYNVQRAWAEYEKRKHEEQKRQKTTLEVMELERQLYRVETVEQAWGRAVNMTRTKILGVPSRAKQQIPHLTPDEIELIRDLLREALEELAAGEVTK
jgi:hypothetical protein